VPSLRHKVTTFFQFLLIENIFQKFCHLLGAARHLSIKTATRQFNYQVCNLTLLL
jgi:hypothetical protein